MTRTSLRDCWMICSMTWSLPCVVMVMRDTPSSSVGATFSVSIWYPRALNRPATRVSIPYSFSTRSEIVCLIGFVRRPSSVVRRPSFTTTDHGRLTTNHYAKIISFNAAPAGTMGNTFSSRATFISISTGPGRFRPFSRVCVTSLILVARSAATP